MRINYIALLIWLGGTLATVVAWGAFSYILYHFVNKLW